VLLRALVAALCVCVWNSPARAAGETLRVLNDTAVGLYEQGQYESAAELAERAVRVAEEMFGPSDPQIITFLNNLAVIYYAQGRYAEAVAQYERAIAIAEAALGIYHPRVQSLRESLDQCRQNLQRDGAPREKARGEAPAAKPPTVQMPVEEKTEPASVATVTSEQPSKTGENHLTLFTVQVGAFKDLRNARSLEAKLAQNGYDAGIVSVTTATGETLHKVRVGAFGKRAKAEDLARELRALLGLGTFITVK